MLNAYPKALTEGLSLSSRDLADQTWFDLVDPTEAERSAFERASGLRVPSKNELGEIEATSRLQIKNDALYMTAPMIFAAENEPWLPTPVGFVLSKQLLMTVRFANSVAFNTVAKETSAAISSRNFAQSQPRFSSPTRFSMGTRTSSRNTSLR